MKARIRYTDIISDFTYHPDTGWYTCDEDTRDKPMVFDPCELVLLDSKNSLHMESINIGMLSPNSCRRCQ